MTTTKQLKVSLVAALVLGATGLSLGGQRVTQEVWVYGGTGSYYAGAQGNVTDARNSTDTMQFISCETTTYSANTSTMVNCIARNAAGQYASCYLSNAPAGMIDQVMSIGPRSTIHFSYSTSSGTCQWIKVLNSSSAGGMQ